MYPLWATTGIIDARSRCSLAFVGSSFKRTSADLDGGYPANGCAGGGYPQMMGETGSWFLLAGDRKTLDSVDNLKMQKAGEFGLHCNLRGRLNHRRGSVDVRVLHNRCAKHVTEVTTAAARIQPTARPGIGIIRSRTNRKPPVKYWLCHSRAMRSWKSTVSAWLVWSPVFLSPRYVSNGVWLF
jgi:hypothetical protein